MFVKTQALYVELGFLILNYRFEVENPDKVVWNFKRGLTDELDPEIGISVTKRVFE